MREKKIHLRSPAKSKTHLNGSTMELKNQNRVQHPGRK